MPNEYNISDANIIRVFLRNSHSIKSIARSLGIPVSYAGKVINIYKKKNNIR